MTTIPHLTLGEPGINQNPLLVKDLVVDRHVDWSSSASVRPPRHKLALSVQTT